MSENKKPRIAEILRVEVGEAFSIDGYPTDYGMVQVCEDGKIRRRCPKEIREVTQLEVGHKIGSNALYYLLNHPERIIRKPRWTNNEIKMAKAIKALWPDAEDIRARSGATSAIEYRVCAGCMVLGVIYDGYFPTMQCGENYALDEIIGGTE